MQQTISASLRPWYKESWLWLIIALPSLVIIGCMYTVYIAYHFADMPMEEDWPQIQHAKVLGITANIQISADTGKITIDLKSQKAVDPKKQLLVQLQHPTLANLDQTLTLTSIGNAHYSGTLDKVYSGDFYVVLEDLKHSWKLKHKIHLPNVNQVIE